MMGNERSVEAQDLVDSERLIERLRAGGQVELSDLFAKLRPQLRSMVQSRLDRRLHARIDASDVVQEAFLRASRGLENYLESPKVHPVVWFRLLSKHLLAETCRYHFRDKRSPDREQINDDGSDILVDKVAASLTSVGSAIHRAELIARVRETMKQLATIDREIIEMRHIEGVSLRQAAEMLELNYETTKKRYFRALKRFRECAANL